MSKEKIFETARTKCINKGYMTGFIEKEDFIMFYKNFLDYVNKPPATPKLREVLAFAQIINGGF
jgi:hypothetical protein